MILDANMRKTINATLNFIQYVAGNPCTPSHGIDKDEIALVYSIIGHFKQIHTPWSLNQMNSVTRVCCVETS